MAFPKKLSPEYLAEAERKITNLADRSYTKVGPEVEVKVGASFWGAYADVELGAGVAKIIEADRKTGETTVSWEVEWSEAGELGYVIAGEGTGGKSSSLTLSVVMDRDGNPLGLEVSSMRQVQGDLSSLNGHFDSLTDFTEKIPERLAVSAGVAHRQESAHLVAVTATLDLTNPDTRDVASRFAERPGPDTGNALRRRMDDSASLLVEEYEGTVKTDSKGFSMGYGVTLGFAEGDTQTTLRSVDAWSWDAVNGSQQLETGR